MSWGPIISGATGSGRAMFRCPGCEIDSLAGSFDIDLKGNRMQCKKCLRIDEIIAFRIVYAPSGHAVVADIVGWASLAFLAWMLVFGLLYSSAAREATAYEASARKSEERLEEIRADEWGKACRRKMAALARALDWRDFPIPERAEDFYQGCLRVYDEGWKGRK